MPCLLLNFADEKMTMRKISFTKRFLLAVMLCLPVWLMAQNKMSIDIASVTNYHTSMNGLNLSGFYHFSERFTGGIEMNRFFPVNRNVSGEDVQQSAWDFDLNFHYLIPIAKEWHIYPVTGISHTSEKELNLKTRETVSEKFWSYNTGAGILWELGKWSPHIEYSFSWGYTNQRFLIAGLSYELDFGVHKK